MYQETKMLNENYWEELLEPVKKTKDPEYRFIVLGKYIEAAFYTLKGMTGCFVNRRATSIQWDILGQLLSGNTSNFESSDGADYKQLLVHTKPLSTNAYPKLNNVYRQFRNPLSHCTIDLYMPDDHDFDECINDVRSGISRVLRGIKDFCGIEAVQEFNQKLKGNTEQTKAEKIAIDIFLTLKTEEELLGDLDNVLKNFVVSLLTSEAENHELIKYWDKKPSLKRWREGLVLISSRCHNDTHQLRQLIVMCAQEPDISAGKKQKIEQCLRKFPCDEKLPKVTKVPTIGVSLDKDDDQLYIKSVKLIEPKLDNFDEVNQKLGQNPMPISHPDDLFKLFDRKFIKILKQRNLDPRKVILLIYAPDISSASIPWHRSTLAGMKRLESIFRCISFSHDLVYQREEWQEPINIDERLKVLSAIQFVESDCDDVEGLLLTHSLTDEVKLQTSISKFDRSFIGLFCNDDSIIRELNSSFITPESLSKTIKKYREVSNDCQDLYFLLNTDSSEYLDEESAQGH
jgi:hypothetical protein